MDNIHKNFPVTESEYSQLDTKFGALCEYASWQLVKQNAKNNHTDEQCDISQQLRISLIRAGSYYKRQVYIENCLDLCSTSDKGVFTGYVVSELQDLWANKTKHGANRQKFGPYQEFILKNLTEKLVPKKDRPSVKRPLQIDAKFTTYCKAIIWNDLRSVGRKISREKSIRSGQVSLSEFDYLVSERI